MNKIRDVDSILERFDWIENTFSIQDVYDYYQFHCSNYDFFYDRSVSDEKNDFYKELYKKLNEKLKKINTRSNNLKKKKIFLSHSHEDFEYTYRVGAFLKKNYNVEVYIDELDSLMPSSTNSDTARMLIKKIRTYDRFIFVGTINSFKSKWCNWELGIANDKNLKGHLAFFVMNDHPAKSGVYDKNEYVGLYPFIWDKKVFDIESKEKELFVGYYKDRDNWDLFIPLKDWLECDSFFFENDSTLINEKKTFAAFYFSKFKETAKKELGYRTYSEAYRDIAYRIGGINDAYLIWRRREFAILFKNIERGADISHLPQRVKRNYDRWNMKTFEDFTLEIKRMIGK